MINEERLLKIIRAPKISEKNSDIKEKNNTVVFKVLKDASKKEILMAAEKIFEVKVKKVNTLIIKGKIKRYGKYINRRKNWKKAYLTLWEGQKLDFIEDAK